jgi:hypothetical protein
MKMNLSRIRNLSVLLLLPILLCAQLPNGDKLYLKNGSIIRGRILEVIPDSIVKIQTRDGNVFVYTISETSKISKDTTAEKETIMPIDLLDKDFYPAFSIFGGMAIPTGDFAKQSGGSAKTGYTVGTQYVSGGAFGWLLMGSWSIDRLNFSSELSDNGVVLESNNWQSIFVLTGIKIGIADPSGIQFFFSPVIGMLFGTIPKIKLTLSSGYLNIPELNMNIFPTDIAIIQNSASSTAFAYGLVGECKLGKHFAIGVQYISGKPKYAIEDQIIGSGITVSGQPVNISQSKNGMVTQNTSLFQIYLAIIF